MLARLASTHSDQVTASAAAPAASRASASRLPIATVSGWSGPRILLLPAASSRHQATAPPCRIGTWKLSGASVLHSAHIGDSGPAPEQLREFQQICRAER